MDSSNLKFIIDILAGATPTFNVTDYIGSNALYNTVTGIPSTVLGIIRATSPNGTVVYGGTSFANNDFSSPDISSPTWQATGLTGLPNPLLSGNYKFDYKIRLKIADYAGSPYTFASCVGGVFTVAGGLNLVNLLGLAPSNVYLQVVSSTPANCSTYPVTFVETGGTVVHTSGSANFAPASGDAIYVIFTITKIYNLNTTTPTTKLNCTASCLTSQITCNDDTAYNIVDANNVTIPAGSVTRTWNVQYPASVLSSITATVQRLVFGSGTAYNSGANIYTGVYGISLTSVSEYDMQTDSYNNVSFVWFKYHITRITQLAQFEVTCSNCMCAYYECIKSIVKQYHKAVRDRDTKKIAELKEIRNQLTIYYMMYNVATNCGDDPTEWCNEIVEISNMMNCTCNPIPTTPVEVIPVQAGSGGGTATKISFNTALTGYPLSPSTYDLCIFKTSGTIGATTITNGDVYLYNGSTWQLQGNWTGSTGSYIYPFIVNPGSVIQDANNTNNQNLYTYPTNSTNDLSTNGDMLEIETLITIANSISGVSVSFGFQLDGNSLGAYTGVNTGVTNIRLVYKITRISATSQYCEGYYEMIGTPNMKVEFTPQTLAVNLATTKNLVLVTYKATSAGAGDIISELQRIKIIKHQ